MSIYANKSDTYGFFTYLMVCPKEQFVEEAIKSPIKLNKSDAEEFANTINDGYAGYTIPLTYDACDAYLIWMPEFVESVDSLVYLAHEVSHVAFKALLHRGWTDFDNETVQHSQMYLKDAIFKDFLIKLEKEVESPVKKKRKNKKK